MAQKTQFLRKQILVQKKIQYRFARFVMLFMFLTALVTSSVIFFTTLILMGDKLAAVYPQGRLEPIVRSVYVAFFVNLLIATPIIWFECIKFSFKIVGPLPKMYQHLKDVGSGVYPGKLYIRATDELQELASEINAMTDQLKARGAVKEQKPPTESQSPPS